MRVLICPDKFGGTLTAIEAADAIARGWRSARPDDELLVQPLSDGGPGFLDVLRMALGGRLISVRTCDPLGRPCPAGLLLVGDTGYLESAHAAGLHLLASTERDPRSTSSYGVGVLVAAAAEAGARRIVLGLGGSGTNDAGAGMLAALGVVGLDTAGYALPPGGTALALCVALEGLPRLRPVDLVAAVDVDAPLVGPAGASYGYGTQKGAAPADLPLLDAALAQYAEILERDLPGCPPALATQAGAGAAGGLGAGVLALGGRVISGSALVIESVQLDETLTGVDLVITGEGTFDAPSLRGKVVGAVARAAQDRGRPCLVLAGQVTIDPRRAAQAGVTASHALADHVGSLAEAMADAADGLRTLAARLARDNVSDGPVTGGCLRP